MLNRHNLPRARFHQVSMDNGPGNGLRSESSDFEIPYVTKKAFSPVRLKLDQIRRDRLDELFRILSNNLRIQGTGKGKLRKKLIRKT